MTYVLTVGGISPAWAELNRSARLEEDECFQYRASMATEIRTTYTQTSVVSFSFPWAYQSFVLALELPPFDDDGLAGQRDFEVRQIFPPELRIAK